MKSRVIRSEYYWDKFRKKGNIYREFHRPSVELLLNIIYTYDVVSTHFSKRIAAHGLSSSTFNVLTILTREENSDVKQQELSRLLLVSRANVTGLVESLVKMGLVERMLHEDDRRARIIRVTDKGRSLVEKILPGHYKEIERIF